MKLLVDAQLPPALAAWLRGQGHEARHVREAGLLESADEVIQSFARLEGAVLITKDRDFTIPLPGGLSPPVVVWVRTGNLPTRLLLQRFAEAWPAVLGHLSDGAQLVEIR